MKTRLERATEKHHELANKAAKQADLRDKCITALVRAQQRYYEACKAVGRSGKRLEALRAEERKAKRRQRNSHEAAEAITV